MYHLTSPWEQLRAEQDLCYKSDSRFHVERQRRCRLQAAKQTNQDNIFFIISCGERSRILLRLTWPWDKSEDYLPANKPSRGSNQTPWNVNQTCREQDWGTKIWDRLFYLSAGPKFTELVNSEDCNQIGGLPSFSQHICTFDVNWTLVLLMRSILSVI